MYQQSLFYLLFGEAWAWLVCPLVTSMFMTKHAAVVDIRQCIATQWRIYAWAKYAIALGPAQHLSMTTH